MSSIIGHIQLDSQTKTFRITPGILPRVTVLVGEPDPPVDVDVQVLTVEFGRYGRFDANTPTLVEVHGMGYVHGTDTIHGFTVEKLTTPAFSNPEYGAAKGWVLDVIELAKSQQAAEPGKSTPTGSR